MTVLLDANVVFDVVGKRQPFYPASNHVLVLCRHRLLTGAVALHAVANLFYEYGRAVLPFLTKRLLPVCQVHGASSAAIQEALRAGFRDLEDALQAAAAQTAGASFIVTRNCRHFRFSSVPAMTPAEFLTRFHPAD